MFSVAYGNNNNTESKIVNFKCFKGTKKFGLDYFNN